MGVIAGQTVSGLWDLGVYVSAFTNADFVIKQSVKPGPAVVVQADTGNVSIGRLPLPVPDQHVRLDVAGGFFRTAYNAQTRPPSDTNVGGLAVGTNYSRNNGEVNLYNVYDGQRESFGSTPRKCGHAAA
jgi:hypothetical protein